MRARPRPLLVLGTALIALSAWGCSPPTTNTKTAGKTTDKAGPPPEPESVFEAHAQGVVYVANAGDDTLTVLDRATLDVVGDPVKAGHQPGSVAVSTTTGRVFFPARFYPEEEIRKTTAKDAIVDNFRSMSYWGIDPAMGNRIVQKAFIGDPEKEGDAVFLALHPQGTWAMISDARNNTVEIRDLESSERPRNFTINVGPGPLGGAFSGDASWYVVANNDPGNTADPDTVSIIDFRNDADGPNEIAKVAVGPNPSYVAISPDNKTAYVTVTGADKVVAVDLETRTVAGEWTVGSGPAGIVRDAAGAFYYVALQGGQVVKVDAATGSIAATATVGEEPVGLAIDEGNNRLLVANRGDDSVSVVKLDTLEVEKTVKVGKEPVAVLLVANPSQPAAPAQPAQPATVENQGTVAVTAETDDAATQPGAPQ